MKTKLLTPFLILAALSSVYIFSCKKQDPAHPHDPSDSTVDLKKGLLVYLPFSGNYADSSGNQNPTTAVGGVSLGTDPSGKASSAMSGTGNGERVVVSNNGSIKFTDAFTFSANILSQQQHDQSFVSMVKRATGKGVTFGLGYGIPGFNRVNFTVSKTNATCDDEALASNTATDTSNLTMATDQWYNLVVTFYKGTLKMYANGVLISTKTGASPTVPICPGAELVVGGWWDDGNAQSIKGKMDEVRLYNRALNDQEIAKLSQGFPAPAGPDLRRGLLVYLPFSGNYADSSGNNNPTTALAGVTLSSDMFGTPNTAMNGTGNGERVVVSNNGSISFDSTFTFSANILSLQQHDQSFVSMVTRATGHGVSFGLGYGIPGLNKVNFTVSKSTNTCAEETTLNNTTVDTSDLTMGTDKWYNIVVTFNKGVQKIYSNGVLISTKVGTSPIVPICPTAELVVGGWWDGGNAQSIVGKMDEVRLYNRVLSADEISQLAKNFH